MTFLVAAAAWVFLCIPLFLFHRSNLISNVNTENNYSIVIAIATKMKSMNSRMLIEQNYMYSKWNALVMNLKWSPVIATANLSNKQKIQMIVIKRCRFTRYSPFCEIYDNELNWMRMNKCIEKSPKLTLKYYNWVNMTEMASNNKFTSIYEYNQM